MSLYGIPNLNDDTTQIRTISAKSFSDLHLEHILSHPPDAVLFPFLHGLEGDNEAQNMFFASQGQSVLPNRGTEPDTERRNLVPVPKYRGLMTVVCEDDLDSLSQLGILTKSSQSAASHYSDDSDYEFEDDDDEDYELDDDEDELMEPGSAIDMDVDVVDSPPEDTAPRIEPHNVLGIVDLGTDEKHMHPVHHRLPAVQPIQTIHLLSTSEDSSVSSSLSSCEDSLFESDPTTASTTTPDTSPTSPSPSFSSKSRTKPPKTPNSANRTPRKRRSQTPLITSTFRARDLIHRVPSTDSNSEEEEWEFAPVRVPDGISLRNFGIQVSILATLSDVVIYSPTAQGALRSDNAWQLAQRFRMAMDKKRKERCSRLGLPQETDELLRYNVFILDANDEQIKHEIPHLVMRVCESGVVPGSLGPGAGVKQSRPFFLLPEHDSFDMDLDDDVAMTDPLSEHCLPPNTVDFAQRERDEMRDLTKASEIISVPFLPHLDLSTTATHFDPMIGQLFLGNSNDVPLPLEGEEEPDERFLNVNGGSHSPSSSCTSPSSSFSSTENPSKTSDFSDLPHLPRAHPLNPHFTNSPEQGYGYDICIECHDMAPFPTQAYLRAAEEKIDHLEALWRQRIANTSAGADSGKIPPRPPPHANAIIHLPFPSSPVSSPATMAALLPVIRFLERCLLPPPPAVDNNLNNSSTSSLSRRWSSVSSFIPSLPSFPMMASTPAPISASSRTRSFTSPPIPHQRQPSEAPIPWSRPLKILLYSSDGYTESSVPALSLLMAVKGLSLPEAYLELQVAKKRSFFVYHYDLGILRRVEARLTEERRDREREKEKERHREREIVGVKRNIPTGFNPYAAGAWGDGSGQNDSRERPSLPSSSQFPQMSAQQPQQYPQRHGSRPPAKSVSFAQSPLRSRSPEASDNSTPPPSPAEAFPASASHKIPRSSATLPTTLMSSSVPGGNSMNAVPTKTRPRASTSPWPMFVNDHQTWFNDHRFDGSFPSRVLPFLYLGNLNHASNAYMLHALGITHVVSVGECALIPPANIQSYLNSTHPSPDSWHFVPGKGPGHPGSLWIEERAGRIKVLDIQGVCDDGIDTLEPQLEPICEWIDKAHKEDGGKILVHCRVGVSRSATVTIAYVMKHLGLSLVDAYLIVRSRRLSVLIQPNMRLLYNLCGWEIKLAKERAGEDPDKLRTELSSTLSWPYLAKEVHALNEKYLH